MNFNSLWSIIFWAIIVGLYSKRKGYSFSKYFFLSFIITPLLSWILAANLVNKTKIRKNASSAGVSIGEYVINLMYKKYGSLAIDIYNNCKTASTDPNLLKEYLQQCKKVNKIEGGYVDLLFEHFFPSYQEFLPI